MKLSKYHKYNKLIDIPIQVIANSNVKCVMIDMDNTLLIWHGETIAKAELDWCNEIKKLGVAIVIVSNAINSRTKDIAEQLGVRCVAPAMKPWPFGLLKAAWISKAHRDESLMIGDQIITDKIAAFLAGIKFILVEPLSEVEFGMTKVNRKIEKFFFRRGRNK